MLYNWLVLVFAFLFLSTGSSLEVLSPEDEISVEDGSPNVILDCPYSVDPGDEEGLVVKWFFDEKPSPQYQWIPGKEPQALSLLKDVVDTSYEASNEMLTKYSDLYIQYPTLNLSGVYECFVSNFHEEQQAIRHLTVYVAADSMNMTHEITEDTITINCEANGIYPEPKLDLYKSVDNNFDSMLLQDPLILTDYYEDNATYSINLTQTFNLNKLDYTNKFLCSLTIPKTDYLWELDVIYEPDPTTTSSTTPPPQPIKSTLEVSSGLRMLSNMFTEFFIVGLVYLIR